MSHIYYCEQLNSTSTRTIEAATPNKVRPSRPSGPYLNATIKGRKLG